LHTSAADYVIYKDGYYACVGVVERPPLFPCPSSFTEAAAADIIHGGGHRHQQKRRKETKNKTNHTAARLPAAAATTISSEIYIGQMLLCLCRHIGNKGREGLSKTTQTNKTPLLLLLLNFFQPPSFSLLLLAFINEHII
jgi:hypothetical protein